MTTEQIEQFLELGVLFSEGLAVVVSFLGFYLAYLLFYR